jgi:ABC-type xylose transport system substrate-binding protein
MISFSREQNTDAETLHGEIDLLGFGPCRIEWTETNLACFFERELTTEQQAQLAAVVAAHDGSAAIAERAEREAKILAIQDANKALVESAREKRLRGEQMSQQELAALVDLLMFPA